MILRMVKDRYMSQVIAPLYLNSNVRPSRRLCFRRFVSLSNSIHHFSLDALVPRHTNEQAADIVFAHGDVLSSFPLPLEVQQIVVASGLHRPGLRFGNHHLAHFVEHVVHRLPLDLLSRRTKHAGGNPAVVITLPFHEEITTVHELQSPEDSSLMGMMRGTIFRDDAV